MTARATSSNSSPFNVGSSRDMPVHQPLQCLYYGSSKAFFCFVLHYHEGGMHAMTSVQDPVAEFLAEALLTLFFA